MREISTEKVKVGEHVLVDGVEYVTEEAIGKMCSLCAFHNSYKCESIPCNGVIFKRVKKESHGRLIDSYSLAVKVAEAQGKLKGKEYDPFMLLGDVLRWIELEPTVLEASEERKK